MRTKKQKSKPKYAKRTCYNKLPVKVSQKEFNLHVLPYLSKGKRGPDPKISYYKIFNYILYVDHTGIQWDQLKPYRNEIHWSKIYKFHNRWSKDGTYRRIFEHSLDTLNQLGLLDLSIFHGDGSNVVAKKGEKKSATPGTNTKKVRKCWP